MTDLFILVPSRGRPHNAAELIDAFTETATGDTQLVFALDEDDPTLGEYQALPRTAAGHTVRYLVARRRRLAGILNLWATQFAPQVPAIGFMGDDHRPRTSGWDQQFIGVLGELGTGIVYGNDLIQGQKLPTAVALTSNIVQGLGYMVPTALEHLYLDNFWLEIGRQLGRIRYLPDVVIEHLHPTVGTAPMDDGYRANNSAAQYERDLHAWDDYVRFQLDADVARLRRVSGG